LPLKDQTAAPADKELTQKLAASLKVLSDFDARFDSEMKYQNQKLKDLEIKVIVNESKHFETRVDDLQVWIDFKDIKKPFCPAGLDHSSIA